MGLFSGFVGVEWLGEVGGSEPQNVELRNIECRREAGGRPLGAVFVEVLMWRSGKVSCKLGITLGEMGSGRLMKEGRGCQPS